jgi:spermidine synthase
MSLGGVLGGAFAALAAPQIFTTIAEYPLLAFAALLARPDVWNTPRAIWAKEGAFVAALTVVLGVAFVWSGSPVSVFAAAVMALAGLMALQGRNPVRLLGLAAVLFAAINLYDPSQSIVYRARSFYGAYKAVDIDGGKFRVLYHGTTAHGAEQLRDDKGAALTGRPEPLTYYYAGGPYAEAIRAIRAEAGGTLHRVALVGLGVGALSCYRKPGEDWTIYELDPMIVRIAHDTRLFRSVSDCAPLVGTVIGDGRLTLRAARPGIDLLILDIFSSDSVPTHMLTREAFALFKARLAPHGAIAFNISNKNMELAKVVAASAAANGMVTAVRRDARPPLGTMHMQAEIAIVARSAADMGALHLGPAWRVAAPDPGQRVWTDDYSAILDAVIAKMRE